MNKVIKNITIVPEIAIRCIVFIFKGRDPDPIQENNFSLDSGIFLSKQLSIEYFPPPVKNSANPVDIPNIPICHSSRHVVPNQPEPSKIPVAKANASLTIQKAVSGCANCYDESDRQLIVQNILPKRDPASYKLTFIIPEVEPVKARSDRHTATFNYHVDRYELLRDYRNNRVQFDEVDRVIGDIRDNQDLEITEFTIAGYASPEGSFEHNRILAQNRANSFAHYLVSKFGVSHDKFTVEGKGEDWEGLRKAISVSFLADKQNILNIIDKVQNPDVRDIELLKLSNGDTYKTLLNNYYPLLRRTEYTVAYVVRAFNVEEAREVIKKNPKLLSLNEMYLVAESYPSNSKEFRDVFDIAVRLYPESEIAIINSAAADIESKNYDTAIERLKRIEEKPTVWNNLGVAYILKGDMEKALGYFNKSADNGDKDASANLEIINRILK